MKKTIIRIFRFLTDSIGKKMLIGFFIVVIPLVCISLYTLWSGKQINDKYNEALQKHILLNDIFICLRTTNDYLEEYLKTNSTNMLNNYNKAYPELYYLTERFSESFEGNNRLSVDLKYMIQTYIDKANSSVTLFKQNNRIESFSMYYSAKHTLHLINGSFKRISTSLTDTTEKLMERTISSENQQVMLNGIFIIVIGSSCLIFGRWFSLTITGRLKKLTSTVSSFAEGKFSSEELTVTSYDEVGILTNAFVKMTGKISQQMDEIRQKAQIEKMLKDEEIKNLKMTTMLKEMQFKSLQSRINPHFLFNTLNLITQMSYLEDAKQTSSLLESMSDLLRYNLDKFGSIVSIEEEIGNVMDYIFIQKKRFGERIRFEVNVSKQSYNCLIPCLVIQPLVENSIIHGVQSYTDNGYIQVKVSRHKERVIIKVSDNGLGMVKERLEEIKNSLNDDVKNSNLGGIGLSNVVARLKIYYEGDVLVHINSSVNKGTVISLDIPAKEKETDNV